MAKRNTSSRAVEMAISTKQKSTTTLATNWTSTKSLRHRRSNDRDSPGMSLSKVTRTKSRTCSFTKNKSNWSPAAEMDRLSSGISTDPLSKQWTYSTSPSRTCASSSDLENSTRNRRWLSPSELSNSSHSTGTKKQKRTIEIPSKNINSSCPQSHRRRTSTSPSKPKSSPRNRSSKQLGSFFDRIQLLNKEKQEVVVVQHLLQAISHRIKSKSSSLKISNSSNSIMHSSIKISHPLHPER